MFAAILDTNVLWPSLRRDFLLSLAVEGLYRPLWSSAILDELRLHEARKLERRHQINPVVAAARADRLINMMRTSFDDALVTGWEGLEGTYKLPDPGDEHVVAAAVVGGAGAVVTENLKDFPESCVPANLDVLDPNEFAANTVDVDPSRAAHALAEIAARRTKPTKTARGWLTSLVELYDMADVAEILDPVLVD